MNKQKTILITGCAGFVARHFIAYLDSIEETWNIIGLDVADLKYDFSAYSHIGGFQYRKMNLLETDALDSVIEEFKPDYVLHLASFSSVAYSWEHPTESFLNNCNIFLNLCNAIQKHSPSCRILSVGSSEEYGIVKHEDIPIKENHPLNPVSPYAVARVSQEMLSKVFVEANNMQIIMTRSFNHIGPGQDERFVIPSFIKRIREIKERGKTEGTIETGDVSIIRDFVDVRDVVRAYYLLLTKGTPGETYNICAGRRIVLGDIVDQIASIVGVTIHTKVNPAYVRPSDNPEIVGTAYKIESELGWTPMLALDKTIKDMIKNEKSLKGE